MRNFKTAALLVAMAAIFTSAPAAALEKGDFILRIGGAIVSPNDSSDSFDGPVARSLGSVKAGVQSDAKPSLIVGYMFTDNIGAQLLAAVPFEHDVTAEVNGASLGEVAKVKHLPPTLTANWHFDEIGAVTPYVGAGVNYTYFHNENTTGALNGLNINLDDSWGPAGVAGFDWDLGDNFLFNMTVYYIKIKSEAHISGGFGNADIDVDPWVVSTGFGYTF